MSSFKINHRLLRSVTPSPSRIVSIDYHGRSITKRDQKIQLCNKGLLRSQSVDAIMVRFRLVFPVNQSDSSHRPSTISPHVFHMDWICSLYFTFIFLS